MHTSLLSSNGERVGSGGGHFETVKNVKPGEDDSKQNLNKNFIWSKKVIVIEFASRQTEYMCIMSVNHMYMYNCPWDVI